MEKFFIDFDIYFCRTIAVFKQPPLSSVNNIFTLPFAYSVWIMMFTMIFIFTVALIFLIWMSNNLKGEKTQLAILLDTVTLVIGAICQQGTYLTRTYSNIPYVEYLRCLNALHNYIMLSWCTIILMYIPLTKCVIWLHYHKSTSRYCDFGANQKNNCIVPKGKSSNCLYF